jgi:Ca2+-binding RTX toxin-like protein
MILPRSVFAKFFTGTEYLQSHQFVVGPASVDADDFLIYNFNTGALSYDIDGNGPIGAIQFAKLKPGLALTSEDFLLV